MPDDIKEETDPEIIRLALGAAEEPQYEEETDPELVKAALSAAEQPEVETLFTAVTPQPRKQSYGNSLADTLKQTGLFSSAMSAIGTGDFTDIRRKPSGDWEIPFMAKNTGKTGLGGLKESLAGMGAAIDQRFGRTMQDTLITDSAPVQKVFHDFQQANNLSDEEMNVAWNDLWKSQKPWTADEKARVFSNGTVRLNPLSKDYFDDAKVEETLKEAGASPEARAEFMSQLPQTRADVAGDKLLAYEAAANVANSKATAAVAAAANPHALLALASAGAVESPSQYAAKRGYSPAEIATPSFIREYETEVLDKQGKVGATIRGLATDTMLGFNKVATTGLGIAGYLGNDAAGNTAAESSKAAGVIQQGKPDTGMVGTIVQEIPSVATQIVASQLTGGLSLLATGGRAAAAVGFTAAIANAGAQSLGLTYAQERADGKTHEEARKKATVSALNTAIITGIFQGLGAGGVEKMAAGKSVAGITLRDVVRAGTRQEVWRNTRAFVGNILKDTIGEASEETIDTFTSTFLNADPDSNLASVWNDTWEALKVGGVLGVATVGAMAVGESFGAAPDAPADAGVDPRYVPPTQAIKVPAADTREEVSRRGFEIMASKRISDLRRTRDGVAGNDNPAFGELTMGQKGRPLFREEERELAALEAAEANDDYESVAGMYGYKLKKPTVIEQKTTALVTPEVQAVAPESAAAVYATAPAPAAEVVNEPAAPTGQVAETPTAAPTNADGQLVPFRKPSTKGNNVVRNDGVRGEIISESEGVLTVEWRDETTSEVKESDLKSRSTNSQMSEGNNVVVTVNKVGEKESVVVTSYDENGGEKTIYESRDLSGASDEVFAQEVKRANDAAEKHARKSNLASYDAANKKRVAVPKQPTAPEVVESDLEARKAFAQPIPVAENASLEITPESATPEPATETVTPEPQVTETPTPAKETPALKKDNLKTAFNLTDEQADAAVEVSRALSLSPDRVSVEREAPKTEAQTPLTKETIAQVRSGVASKDPVMRELWAELMKRKLEKNGVLTWRDIPQDLANGLDTVEFAGLKSAISTNPEEAIALVAGTPAPAQKVEPTQAPDRVSVEREFAEVMTPEPVAVAPTEPVNTVAPTPPRRVGGKLAQGRGKTTSLGDKLRAKPDLFTAVPKTEGIPATPENRTQPDLLTVPRKRSLSSMRAEVVRKLDELEAEDLDGDGTRQSEKEMRLKGLLGKIETAMMAERKGATVKEASRSMDKAREKTKEATPEKPMEVTPEKTTESRVEEYTVDMPKMEKGRVAKVLNKPARVGDLTLPVAEHIQRGVDAGAKITEQVTRNVLTPKRKAELQKESDSLFKEVAGKTRDDSNPNWVRYMEVRKALSDNAETVMVENFEMPNGDGMRLGVTEMRYAKWLMGNTAPTEKVSNDTKPAPTEGAKPPESPADEVRSAEEALTRTIETVAKLREEYRGDRSALETLDGYLRDAAWRVAEAKVGAQMPVPLDQMRALTLTPEGYEPQMGSVLYPEGYVKQGDLYVYAPTDATAKVEAPAAPTPLPSNIGARLKAALTTPNVEVKEAFAKVRLTPDSPTANRAVVEMLEGDLSGKKPARKALPKAPPSFVRTKPIAKKIRIADITTEKGMIEALEGVASEDETRYVLNGVYFDANAQVAVATNGRQIVVIPTKVSGDSRILAVRDGVGDSAGTSKARKLTGITGIKRGDVIEGNYPQWRRVIPDYKNTRTTTKKWDIADLAAKARGAARAWEFVSTKLIKGGIYEQEGIKIKLDPEMLTDILEAFQRSGATTVTLEIADSESPVLFKADNGAYGVQMPMLLVDKRAFEEGVKGMEVLIATDAPPTDTTERFQTPPEIDNLLPYENTNIERRDVATAAARLASRIEADRAGEDGANVSQRSEADAQSLLSWAESEGRITPGQWGDSAREDIRFQNRPQGAKGSAQLTPDGKVLLKGLQNPDFTTAVHEMAHAFEMSEYQGLNDDEVSTLKAWAGSRTEGRKAMERKPSEKFARGWERYIAEGRAPLPNLQALFDKMAKWMLDVYGQIKGSEIDVDISPEVRAIFDKLASRMQAPAAIVTPTGVEMHTEGGTALPQPLAPNEEAPAGMSPEDEMAGRIIHAATIPVPRVIESGDDWNPDDLYSLQKRRALEEAEQYDLNTDGWVQAARAFPDLWDTVTSQPQGTGEAMLDRLVATGDIDRVLTDREVATLTHEGLRRKVAVDKAAEELGTVIAQGASKELVAEKQAALDDAMARYQTIQNVAAKARTASGRALNAWKYALRNDFSYATLQSRTLAAYNSALIQDGKKPVADLPADQKEKIRKYSEEQRALQEEISRLRAAAETNAPEEYLKRIAEQDALIAAMIEERKQSANKSAVSDLTKRLLVDKVRKAAREARARLGITDDGIRYQSAPNAANDPRWYDRVLVLAEPLIANPTMTAARFADIVLKQFGSAYEGVADLLRKDVEKHIRTTLADISGKNSPSPEEVVSGLSADQELTRQDVYELARAYVFEGARDFEVMNKVFADLSQIYPELTKDEVTQLFTNYGKQQKLSPTEEATALRAARSLELVQKQIDDLEARGQMKRTGLAKDDPSPELRALRKRRDDLAKEIGYTPTDPATGLSSAQGAAKKRMSNEIQELERAIASGERRVRVRRGVEYTEDMNVLREKLLALRDTYENTFESERTPEERMRLMLTDLDRRIAKERDLINKGILKYEKEALPPLDSPELTARRELLRNLRAEKFAAYDLLNPNERSLNQAMKEAQAAVERRQKLLDEGLRETPPKRERGEGVNPTEALRALWEAADAMDVLIREIRKNRPLTPAQQQAQLDRAYAQAVTSREALRTKIETGDILSPPKTAKAVEERTRAIREENAAMRKQIVQMQRDAGVGAFAPEVREAKRVASLEARIAELKRRRAEKDFSKKAVAKPVTNEKIAQLELDMELARYKFEEARARDAYKGLRWSTRKVEEAMAVWHARQMFNLSGDLGIFGRQLGKVGTLALQADLQTLWNRKKNKEPLSIKEGTVIGKTLGTGLKVFLNPELGDRFYADLATSPRYAFLKANGLDLTKPHESSHELSSDGRIRVNPMLLFSNRILGAVMIGRGLIGMAAAIKVAIHTSAPVWKAVTKGIADTLFGAGLAIGGIEFAKRVESAQLAMLNVARVAITEAMLKMTDHLAPADKEAASQAIVETVMTFTGKISGKSGLSKWLKNNAYEVGLLFSFPQYMYTNLQAATGTPMIKAVRDLLQGKPGSKTTLAAVSLMSAHMYGGYAARIVAWAILFGVWDEEDVESTYGVVMNPDNPNFLKLKVGKTYIDFAAGWAAWLVKLNRFASDTKLNSEMLRDGYEVEEEKTSFDKMGVAGKFLKGQLQANIRTALEFFVEDEFREGGKLSKMDVWNKADLLLNEIVMNLTARDIRKMYDEHDPATATILSALLMTGRNINIRETTAEMAEREAEEKKRYTK